MLGRHAKRTGASRDLARPPLTHKWTVLDTGSAFHSSPVVYDGLVYIGGGDGKIYALDAYTGDVQWSYQTGDEVRATPCVVRGALYVGSLDGHIYALNAKTGELLWKAHTGAQEASSPVVVNRALYSGSGFPHKFIRATDIGTGESLWEEDTGQYVSAAPASDGDLVVSGAGDGKLYFLDAADGENRFSPYATGAKMAFVAPVLGSDAVYAASGDYQKTLYAFSPDTGQVKWSAVFPYHGAQVSSPVLTPAGVYVAVVPVDNQGTVDAKARLLAYDASSGAAKAGFTVYQTGNAAESRSLGYLPAPAATDGVLYWADADGKLHVVDETTGAALAAPLTVGGGSPVVSSVAEANGWVYVASSDGKLYAYQADEIAALAAPSDVDFLSNESVYAVKAAIKPAAGQSLQACRVEYGAGISPTEWLTLSEGTTAADGSIVKVADWDVSGLTDGDYTLRLTAVFSGGTRVVTHAVRLRNSYAETLVSAAQGVHLVSADGTELIIPPGALSEDDFLTLSTPASVSDEGIPAGITATAIAREILLGKPETTLMKPVTLKVPYKSAQIAGLNPARLRLYTWNASDRKWEIVNTSKVDAANQKVTAELHHFSIYRIMAYAPAAGRVIEKGTTYATPNPATGDTAYFKVYLNDDADVTVQVFNVAGEKIAELKGSGLGGTTAHLPWSMGHVASGVYVFRVEAKSTTRTDEIIKKLAVIH